MADAGGVQIVRAYYEMVGLEGWAVPDGEA